MSTTAGAITVGPTSATQTSRVSNEATTTLTATGTTSGNSSATTTSADNATTATPVPTQDPSVSIIAIVAPTVAGILSVGVLVGYFVFNPLGQGGAAAASAAAVPPPLQQPPLVSQAPKHAETSFYSPGYAFNRGTFAGGFGRF